MQIGTAFVALLWGWNICHVQGHWHTDRTGSAPYHSAETLGASVVRHGLVAFPDTKNATVLETEEGRDLQQQPLIREILVADGRFTILVAAMNVSGILYGLDTIDATVFAPTDDAFQQMEGYAELVADLGALPCFQTILRHIIFERITLASFYDGLRLSTVQGSPIYIHLEDDQVRANNATIVEFDLLASNGVIHVVDDVITFNFPLVNLVETIRTLDGSSFFVTAMEQSGLEEMLSGPDVYTVILPLDEFFSNNEMDALLADDEALKEMVLNHVVRGTILADDIYVGMRFDTLSGETIMVKPSGFNNAEIRLVDIKASNGVVHVINGVLDFELGNLQDVARDFDAFTYFLAAVDQAELAGLLTGTDNYTMFMPYDDIFQQIDIDAVFGNQEVLRTMVSDHIIPGKIFLDQDDNDGTEHRYQTLSGKTVTIKDNYVNGAAIVGIDVEASNGVIQVINSFLTFGQSMKKLLKNDGRFGTLVQLLRATETLDTIDDQPLTLFAPTDEAFAKMGTMEDIVAESYESYVLLLSHAVARTVLSRNFEYDTKIYTEGGKFIILTQNTAEGTVLVNNATITEADVETRNGVVHVIDDVLTFNFPLTNLYQTILEYKELPLFARALEVAGLVDMLSGGAQKYTVFAPTDVALREYAGTVDNLLASPERLRELLLNHVVPGDKVLNLLELIEGSDGSGGVLVTAGGKKITIDDKGFNGAGLVVMDVEASNGMMHVLSAVLVFDDDEVKKTVAPTTPSPTSVPTTPQPTVPPIVSSTTASPTVVENVPPEVTTPKDPTQDDNNNTTVQPTDTSAVGGLFPGAALYVVALLFAL